MLFMKFENEITVLVKTDYKSLEEELKKLSFVKKEQYEINDIYMINNDIDLLSMKTLDILKNCILIRDIVGIEKQFLYKYKEYNNNGDILRQAKVKCPITDIGSATSFMGAINYKELFRIYDKCIVFANDKTELVVQIVNNKYIFIEMETEESFNDKKYMNIDEMKEELFSYNLSIDKSNIFVKKAEIILNEKLNNN